MQESWVWSLGQEDPLEEEMATYSNILAWEVPQTEEPGQIQSMMLQRVGHNWMTFIFTFASHSLQEEAWTILGTQKEQTLP